MNDTNTTNLEKLLKIGKEVLAEPDVDHVLDKSVDHLIAISGAERGLIILYNDQGDRHIQTARNLQKEDIENPEFEISSTIIENVKQSGEHVFLKNALRDKNLDQSKSVLRLKILSVICLPLTKKEKVFGVVYLDNRTIQGRFTDEINDLVISFVDFISLAAFHTVERNHWKKRTNALENELRFRYDFDAIIGQSPQMVKVMEMISQVAETDATVLVEGETGTGKELTVRAIHLNSPRKDKPLLVVNCAAFPENLLESEFFGHEKGSFTGADKHQRGKFELADGGTLFLDEVDEMSPTLQVKLLRAIQFGEFTPIGSEVTKTSDVRIIATCKSDLQKLVSEGKFREDLYYRLNLFLIKIPPLRERNEDISLLAEYFLLEARKRLKKRKLSFSKNAIEVLESYDYPGNIRELENIVHRAAILCRTRIIEREMLPNELSVRIKENINFSNLHNISFKDAKDKVVSEFERSYIEQVLEECGGVISQAADKMGMHKKNLHEKLNKYNIYPHKN